MCEECASASQSVSASFLSRTAEDRDPRRAGACGERKGASSEGAGLVGRGTCETWVSRHAKKCSAGRNTGVQSKKNVRENLFPSGLVVERTARAFRR